MFHKIYGLLTVGKRFHSILRHENGERLMTDIIKFYLDRYELIVDLGSYIVEAHELHTAPPFVHTISDLPDWIFQSRLAIWLAEEGTSIYNRSVSGEKIRESLKSRLSGKQVVKRS